MIYWWLVIIALAILIVLVVVRFRTRKNHAPESPEDQPPPILVEETTVESVLDVAAATASLAPWIGGPISQVIGGINLERKMGRVKDALDIFATDLGDFKSEAAERYVNSDEFHELTEKTLRSAADERNEEKRRMFARFLANNIKMEGPDYDEGIKILKILEAIQPFHIRLLKAILGRDVDEDVITSSPMATLKRRLPGASESGIEEAVRDITDHHLINGAGLGGGMTGRGAQLLGHWVTKLGKRFLEFLKADEDI